MTDGGVSRQDFVAAVAHLAGEVYDFHRRFPHPPQHLAARFHDRQAIRDEEEDEMNDAIKAGNTPAAGHEAADLLVVVLGDVERLGSDGLRGLEEVCIKSRGKTADNYAVAPTGKVLPLEDGRAHKWAGMEPARVEAVRKSTCGHQWRYYPHDSEKYCRKCKATIPMDAEDRGRKDDYN